MQKLVQDKYGSCPCSRASAREAIMPVTKSKHINPTTHHISGTIGAKSAASESATPLIYLHKASITATTI